MNRLLSIFTLILALSIVSISFTSADEAAQMESQPAEPSMIMTIPSKIVWGEAPDSLPAGVKLAVLEGDPMQAQPYTLRLMMPDGYKVPAHWHTMIERVTVVSGTMHAGMGDKLDPAQATAFPAGGFVFIPAKMHHFAWAEGDTVIQINGDGPFDIHYIDPADDPRNTE